MVDATRIPLAQRVDYLKDRCRGKSVLHLGCADWPYTNQRLEMGGLLHLELAGIASELWGFDFDEPGIEILRKRGVPNLYRADLEHLEAVEVNRTFEVILAGEVIEHLPNPGLFLRGIRRFMGSETLMVITTINAYCGLRFLIYALRGRGGTTEPVHPDHVAYYSFATIHRLLDKVGMDVRRFLFYDIGPEHRPHHEAYKNWINDLLVRFSPQLADGVIVECALRKA